MKHFSETRRRKRILLSLVYTTFLLLLAAPCAFAQEVTGSIQGEVKDTNGAVVPGAPVTATNEQRTFNTTTDDSGTYSFKALPPGRYSVAVSAQGFAAFKRDDIVIELGRTLQVNFDLAVAGASEVVNVSGGLSPIVDVTSTKTATNITSEQIAVLPKSLNFTSVLEVAPGTRQETRSGGFQIDGASGSENVYVIDGVEVTNIVTGTLGARNADGSKNIPLDFVQEVQVKSAGYEAEYGGATGGVINVVTKSGTNEFHGELRFDLESDKLRGNDRPELRRDPLNTSKFQYLENRFGKDRRRTVAPVFTLGGPIVKNRLWFFTSYAPQFRRIERNLDRMTDPTSGLYALFDTRVINYTSKTDYFLGKLDFAPSDKVTANISFLRSPVETHGPSNTGGIYLLNRETSAPTEFSFFDKQGRSRFDTLGGYSPSWQVAGALTYIVTPKLVLSFRGGHTYLNDKAGSYGIGTNEPLTVVSEPCRPENIGGRECPAGSTSIGYPTGLTNNGITNFDITRRTNLNFDASYIARIFGQQHNIKAGYQSNLLSNNVDYRYAGGLVTFFFGRDRGGQRGTYGYYQVDDFARIGKVSSNNHGLFVQDSWQVHPRLTANLGLRIEREALPGYPLVAEFHPSLTPEQVKNAQSKPIDFGWSDKIAPRLGGAWDVLGDGKLKLAASYSVFYDTMKYELARGSFGGEKYLRSRYTLDTPDFLSINLTNLPGRRFTGPSDLRFPSNLAGIDSGIDPDIKPFRQHEYSVSADYNFAQNYVFSARLTRKVLDRAIEDVGFADAQGNEFFTIGNPGFGLTADTSPATPKAVRNYTGLELRLDKRFSNNWYGNVSYVYSKLYGNYSGLASSDEIPDTTTGLGRTAPNVNRYYDFPFIAFDSTGKPLLGRLSTDRPNTFKAFTAYRFNYGLFGAKMNTEVGASQYIYQGTPLTTEVNVADTEQSTGALTFVAGRGDMGRTNLFTQTDLLLTHFISLGERARLRFSFNVLNLFNERNELDRYRTLTAPGQVLIYDGAEEYLSSNGDWRKRLDEQNVKLDPRYNKSILFQQPFNARFSIGIQF
jgi:outer membrane receptor protein involved in Fe transport